MLWQPEPRYARIPVWAPPRSLAATGGIVVTFSSCGYLDVSVPRVRLRNLRMTGSLPPGCPIRTSAGQCAFATRRSFSQLVTSFFASRSLGILHAPLPFRLYLVSCLQLGGMTRKTSPTSPFDLLVKLLLCFYSCLLTNPRSILREVVLPALSLSFLIVENNGFEPLTLCVQGRCSSQLS